MIAENAHFDRKSIRIALGKKAGWPELAKDCVAFSNASGGELYIGIEDTDELPPPDQKIPDDLPEQANKRLLELTVNVSIAVEKRIAGNGGEYLVVAIARSHSAASTTDGRYFLRVGNESKPLVGEEIHRLLDERSAQPWETLITLRVDRSRIDPAKLDAFIAGIRASDRVKPSVKEKSAEELIDHYSLALGALLTNLGILCVGQREDRVRLGTAPIVQYIKYDEDGRKVNKIVWDDYRLTPMELVDAVWREVPDFRESYEIPEGLFKQQIPSYDQRVVRELLVNALVHRPYTQRGDIYLNMYPDRLELVNPGKLPLGVTPRNILHQSVRRNNELARLFHDLVLMEREGSGYDLIYEVLTSQGRPVPEVHEGADYVEVVVRRRILKPEILDFLVKVDQRFSLTQRERIALGILIQHEGLSSRELADMLELEDATLALAWIERSIKWQIVKNTGKTKGTRYFVDPELIRKLEFPAGTSLARIEPPRLRALILEDLIRHPGSALSEIRERIGIEIPEHQIRRQVQTLETEGLLRHEGERRWRRYWQEGKSI
jgi:ATP-dependent DNA helicase RecG